MRDRDPPAVFTIGHSNRPLSEFVKLLHGRGIECVSDVRSFPSSRHNPQFNRDALARALAAEGIVYEPRPGLGGHRRPQPDSPNQGWRSEGFRGYADYMQTPDFDAEIDALLAAAAKRRCVAMCAEALPWRCHRWLIADALLVRGRGVGHILSAERIEKHRLTPFAEVRGTRLTYPFALTSPSSPNPT